MGTIVRAQPKQQYFDANGDPASGYKVYTYEPGTTTFKTTYVDSAQTSANTNPVILDSRGEADIWWSGVYKVKFTDTTDVEIWTVDNYGAGESASSATAANLIANYSFEVDTEGDGIPDGWDLVNYTGSTNEIVSTDQDHGLNSMKFISTGSGGGYITTESFIEASPSEPLQLSFSINSSVVDVRNLVQLVWYTETKVASTTPTTSVYDDSTTNPTTWARFLYAVIPPSDAYYCKVRLYGCHSSDATAGNTLYDNVVLKPLLSEFNKGADVASATALAVGDDGNYFDVTGTTTITSINTVRVGITIQLHFDGILTLTHNATDLILPGTENITTAAGDEAEFVEYATGDWRCINYSRANGESLDIPDSSVTNYKVLGGVDAAYYFLNVGDGSDGSQTISSNSNIAPGVYNYTTLDVQNTFTWTVDAKGPLIIRATESITIAGTIDASGTGGEGGAATGVAEDGAPGAGAVSLAYLGGSGGGGGGGQTNGAGGVGGSTLFGGGGAGGAIGTNNGANGSNPTTAEAEILWDGAPVFIYGGAGGGAGGQEDDIAGAGGAGGGTIVLIAPTITFTGTLNANGDDGQDTNISNNDEGGGGGGGGGVIITAARTYPSFTGTRTVVGGSGGAGSSSGAGGAGGNGWNQKIDL